MVPQPETVVVVTQGDHALSREVEAVTQFYAALNRGDVDAAVSDFDQNIVRHEFEGSPMAGSYHGIPELRENFTKGRSTWAEGSCRPERFLVGSDKAVVYVHVRVRLKGADDWIDGRIADGFTFRDGKITEFHSFLERSTALAWAGIDASDAA